jgi:hypothetical protein
MVDADRFVRRLAEAVEEDEQLPTSLCHAVWVARLAPPLADAMAGPLRTALDEDAGAARELVAAYWRLIDVSLEPQAATLDEAALREALDALDAGDRPDAAGALRIVALADEWRRDAGS